MASDPAPVLYPTVRASWQMIESDMQHHDCAYVVELEEGEFMVHPNKLTVYGEPKIRKDVNDV